MGHIRTNVQEPVALTLASETSKTGQDRDRDRDRSQGGNTGSSNSDFLYFGVFFSETIIRNARQSRSHSCSSLRETQQFPPSRRPPLPHPCPSPLLSRARGNTAVLIQGRRVVCTFGRLQAWWGAYICGEGVCSTATHTQHQGDQRGHQAKRGAQRHRVSSPGRTHAGMR